MVIQFIVFFNGEIIEGNEIFISVFLRAYYFDNAF